MKSVFFAVATIIVLSLTACGGGNSNKQNTHTHEDGSVHGEHATEQAAPAQGTHKHGDGSTHADHAAPVQESFKVEADSATVKVDTVKHDHNHGHDHSETGHKH